MPLTAHSTIPRTPAELAAFVPEGVESLVLSAPPGPGLREALAARGTARIHSPAGEEDLPAAAAPGGSLHGMQCKVLLSDYDLPHYRNPTPFLAAAHSLLVPGGLLVLCTPNIQYHRAVRALAEEGWAYEPEGVWARKNLRFFTAVELKRLVSEHGYEPLRAASLRVDPPDALPLDAEGFARTGRLTLGPLSPAEYQCYLAADIVCLAMKPAW
jgi:hypothetical protein